MEPPLPFEHLGPYRLVRRIGKGGMGSVFEAVEESASKGEAELRTVAVKLIAESVADEPRFRRRFDGEVRSLEKLRHPNIVSLLGFGEQNGRLFYSMEMVRGETLRHRIRQRKRLEIDETIAIAIDVCGALKHAHDFGIIHRDLKPANLVFASDGRVKLVDFGIAKIFGSVEHQTAAGSVLGTADYMAPEQADGEGIGPRTDLYAVGSLMYTMLAGRPPFRGRSLTEVIDSVRRKPPPPLAEFNLTVPDELSELIEELLAKEPSRRPPTALAVMNRLKAMRHGLKHRATVMEPELDDRPTIAESPAGSKTQVGGVGGVPSVTAGTGMGRGSADPGSARPADSPGPGGIGTGAIGTGGGDFGVTPPRPTAATRPTFSDTSFQTVAPERPAGGDADAGLSPIAKLGTAALLSGVLLLGAFGLWRGLSPPAAADVYARAASGDTAAMEVWIRDHPDDPRTPDIVTLRNDRRVDGVVQRLRTRQRLGLRQMSPAAEGFVEAMRDREVDRGATAERLRDYAAAMDGVASDPPEEPPVQELVELARYEASRLGRNAGPVDERLGELLTRVETLTRADDPTRSRRGLEGLIRTFESKPWAGPAVEAARAALDELGG